MSRRHDPRRAKAHRNYTAAEIAELYDVTVETARRWRHEGLEPIDDKRPFLFAGADIAVFLRAKNKPRVRLEPGQFYCVSCKAPCAAEGNRAILVRLGENNWGLRGTCPISGHEMNRRVSLPGLEQAAGPLEVRHEDGTVALAGDRHGPRIDLSEGDEE